MLVAAAPGMVRAPAAGYELGADNARAAGATLISPFPGRGELQFWCVFLVLTQSVYIGTKHMAWRGTC
jgi:hypothetical protein